MVQVNGERLAQYRKSRMLSIRDLALKADLSWNTVHRLERGKRVSTRSVRKAFRALGVSVDDAYRIDVLDRANLIGFDY